MLLKRRLYMEYARNRSKNVVTGNDWCEQLFSGGLDQSLPDRKDSEQGQSESPKMGQGLADLTLGRWHGLGCYSTEESFSSMRKTLLDSQEPQNKERNEEAWRSPEMRLESWVGCQQSQQSALQS